MKKSEIMARAHAETRAWTAEHPEDSYRAVFAASLKNCWADYKNSPRAEWERMSDTAQYDFIIRMVWHMKKRDCGTDAQGNERMPVMDWIVSTDDALSVAHDAFCRLPALFDKADQQETPPALARVLSIAVLRAARYSKRKELKHANAMRHAVDIDGSDREFVESYAAPDRIAPNPENAALIRDGIDRAARDDIDRAIIAGLAKGYSLREMSKAIGKSHQALSKRLDGIRDRYRAKEEA